ncbi:Serine/Threonine-kinase pakA protein [Trifolium repens]|nr:Serine/Threonine-kinase pakA protein [Trifolium repens]
METEKHHRTTSNNSSTSELFVCFTSRLSSSSMKLSSKSILSPSRSRDQPQISLSSSLSRRLKSNGSMKGGQASPMFPTGGKKRGCGFENPEPSSPKVTCIGQVRVKTKKQGKKMRSRSKRRGEASFRRGENNPDLTRQNSQSLYQNHQNLQQECLKHRNQRWVHLPLTICEALREFSCFFPCRSSCMSNEREKEEKGSSNLEGRGEVERERSGGGHGREGSCGAAFARWLVAYDGKGREIEVMMEHHEMEMEMDDEDVDVDGREKGERSYSQRRHIFEDLDIDLVDEKIQQEQFQGEEEVEEKEKEKGRVSICVPPKNALLLMRCRSDPVKMAALANRFWESPIHKEQLQDDNQHEHHNEVDEQDESSGDEDDEQEQEGYYKGQNIEMEQVEEEEEPQQLVEVVETMSQEEDNICEIEDKRDQEVDEEITKEDGNDIDEDKDETFTCVLLDSSHADLEKQEIEETHQEEHEEKQENKESSELFSSFSSSSSTTSPETFLASSEQENNEQDTESESENAEKVSTEEEQEEKVTVAENEQDPTQQGSDPEMGLVGSTERENGSKKEERERETLPECLLLMMCEPKLSMEVSKETWVCSTDFIRWLPERPVGKVAGGEKKVTVESSSSKPKVKVKTVQPLMQPPRSSCSFPVTGSGAGMSMATMIEQKLMGCSKSRNGYEPFVLKRCKSEPMRSATKLAPEACFWNNRKLEPHPPPASLGVGAPAGVGF